VSESELFSWRLKTSTMTAQASSPQFGSNSPASHDVSDQMRHFAVVNRGRPYRCDTDSLL